MHSWHLGKDCRKDWRKRWMEMWQEIQWDTVPPAPTQMCTPQLPEPSPPWLMLTWVRWELRSSVQSWFRGFSAFPTLLVHCWVICRSWVKRRISILFIHHLSHPEYCILNNIIQAGHEPKAAASPAPLPWSEPVQVSFLFSPVSSKLPLLFCLSHRLHPWTHFWSQAWPRGHPWLPAEPGAGSVWRTVKQKVSDTVPSTALEWPHVSGRQLDPSLGTSRKRLQIIFTFYPSSLKTLGIICLLQFQGKFWDW